MLPGVFGRIDHFGYDGQRGNLFVSALGNNTVEVVNNLRVIHTIRGLGHPQASLYVGEFDKLAVSAKDGKLRFYDGKSFALLKTLDFGSDADNLRYEPDEKRIYVGYGDGAIAAVDPARMERLPLEFALGSHPESFQFERRGSRIFVNLPDQEAIGVIDRKTGAVTQWRIPGMSTNHALAFDEAGRRLFSAALQPGKLWVIDSDSGRVVVTLRIGRSTPTFTSSSRRSRARSGAVPASTSGRARPKACTSAPPTPRRMDRKYCSSQSRNDVDSSARCTNTFNAREGKK